VAAKNTFHFETIFLEHFSVRYILTEGLGAHVFGLLEKAFHPFVLDGGDSGFGADLYTDEEGFVRDEKIKTSGLELGELGRGVRGGAAGLLPVERYHMDLAGVREQRKPHRVVDVHVPEFSEKLNQGSAHADTVIRVLPHDRVDRDLPVEPGLFVPADVQTVLVLPGPRRRPERRRSFVEGAGAAAAGT
jgi:hypothetical protein